jgi:hypothetical protein
MIGSNPEVTRFEKAVERAKAIQVEEHGKKGSG